MAKIRGLKPSYKQGEFCRAIIDGAPFECIVMRIIDDEKVLLQTIGYSKEAIMSLKEVLPSGGKAARDKQEHEVAQIVTWKIGDACRVPYGPDGKICDCKIAGLEQNSDGVKYAIVTFQDSPNEESVWLDDLLLAYSAPIDWTVGDHCRALYQDDKIIYEAVIISFDVDENGKRYSVVRFLGYNNEDTVWYDEILPTLGSASRKAQEMAAKEVEEDVNDAPPISTESLPKDNAQVKPAKAVDWKVSARCRATFTKDGIEYEATLKAIEEDTDGRKYAVLHYVGYVNEEKKLLSELLPSAGKEARDEQRKCAKGASETTTSESVKTPEETIKNDENNNNWEIGMNCRAIFSEDSVEYEGTLQSLEADENGRFYGAVHYLGKTTDMYDQHKFEVRST
jgi:hypothetical protein